MPADEMWLDIRSTGPGPHTSETGGIKSLLTNELFKALCVIAHDLLIYTTQFVNDSLFGHSEYVLEEGNRFNAGRLRYFAEPAREQQNIPEEFSFQPLLYHDRGQMRVDQTSPPEQGLNQPDIL